MWAARYSAPAGGGLLASQKRSAASSSERITRSRRRCNHPHGNSRPSRASPGSRPTNARSSVNSCSGPAAPSASAGRAPPGGGGRGGGGPGGGGRRAAPRGRAARCPPGECPEPDRSSEPPSALLSCRHARCPSLPSHHSHSVLDHLRNDLLVGLPAPLGVADEERDITEVVDLPRCPAGEVEDQPHRFVSEDAPGLARQLEPVGDGVRGWPAV